MNEMRGQITDAFIVAERAIAGNATLTFEGQAARFTYKIQAPKGKADDTDAPRFVKVLTGPNNESDFVFIGTIFAGDRFFPSRKSPISADAPSVRAFAWTWAKVARADQHTELPAGLKVWHEGRCCRCGRKLTVPESVASGLGPECASRV